MERLSFDLSDRIAVITGGGTGIGKSIAAGLAEAGATVVLCGRRRHKCEEACREIGTKTGSEAYACRCDVTDKKQIEGFVKDIVNRFGHIHILVNNAGVASNYHALDLPEEEWDRVLDTNLKGCFLFSQAVGKFMAAAKSGTIINIGSQLGDVAKPNRAHYSTSKGGIKILTKALAVDLAAYGIRVNAVAPGPVETEMARPALSDPDLKSKILEHIPLGRIGQSDDICGAVVFLASDAASYITGVTLYVDGGYLAV
jgi:NAD(P)-dependent dehydrogenase (short-subunit alcohol dehydrogenase family)